MRILFDSKKPVFKTPFGTLTPNEKCTLSIHIPADVGAVSAQCILTLDGTKETVTVPMALAEEKGAYEVYRGSFCLTEPGLYFYYFRVFKEEGSFRLFKVGDDTNMEAGSLWQVTCTPADFTTPDWAKGAVIYQVFPDRFHKSGSCDLTGKLEPYTVHRDWYEEVLWQPTPDGEVLNNDFYGGNFRGITEKLDYIASLGTTILYLNPICKAFSSHRYDTGDYKQPDPMLGTMEDFTALCDAAHSRGIRVILDGVFSHTGSNSLYFDRQGVFGGEGAYCKEDSPYRSWYTFHHWPHSYNCWWNFDTLPTVNKLDPAYLDYIITGETSVVAHWLKAGADGFRLDVADELPNEFMLLLKKRVRQIKPDALVLGEVWEDASNKEAYGVRCRYFADGTLDSVMNYPFRTAILNFMKGHDDGSALMDTVMTLMENYPAQVFCSNMNLLGTHDTARILTALVDDYKGPREELAARHLIPAQLKRAKAELQMASFLQYMLPGSPSLYYGDEAGMEGYADPFNRRTYPWGKEDRLLLTHYRHLGALRREHEALRLGQTAFFCADGQRLGFIRRCNGETLRVYVNRSNENWDIPAGTILYGHDLAATAPDWLCLAPMGFCVTKE